MMVVSYPGYSQSISIPEKPCVMANSILDVINVSRFSLDAAISPNIFWVAATSLKPQPPIKNVNTSQYNREVMHEPMHIIVLTLGFVSFTCRCSRAYKPSSGCGAMSMLMTNFVNITSHIDGSNVIPLSGFDFKLRRDL